MSDLRKAAEMALEEFELFFNTYPHMEKGYTLDAREALRQALAQPEQEPVVEFMGRRLTPEKTRECWGILLCDSMLDPPKHTKLYTAPPKREWVGLTEPERLECYDLNPARFASNIEAKLKEKNT